MVRRKLDYGVRITEEIGFLYLSIFSKNNIGFSFLKSITYGLLLWLGNFFFFCFD